MVFLSLFYVFKKSHFSCLIVFLIQKGSKNSSKIHLKCIQHAIKNLITKMLSFLTDFGSILEPKWTMFNLWVGFFLSIQSRLRPNMIPRRLLDLILDAFGIVLDVFGTMLDAFYEILGRCWLTFESIFGQKIQNHAKRYRIFCEAFLYKPASKR